MFIPFYSYNLEEVNVNLTYQTYKMIENILLKLTEKGKRRREKKM